MEIKATVKYLRLSPTKTRLVIDTIRGKKATQARDVLKFAPQKPARLIAKLLQSAIANAVNNFEQKEEDLIVKKITADAGPVLKRLFPRAHGRGDIQRKPLTHIDIILEGLDKKLKKKAVTPVGSEIVKAEATADKKSGKLFKKSRSTSSDKNFNKQTGVDRKSNYQRKTGER